MSPTRFTGEGFTGDGQAGGSTVTVGRTCLGSAPASPDAVSAACMQSDGAAIGGGEWVLLLLMGALH